MKAESASVNSFQLACMLVAFSAGSAIVYIPNPISEKAKNGAWLSMIPAFGFGLLILACILYLHGKHPGRSLIAYSRELIGGFLTSVAAVLLIAMCLFAVSAITAGIGDFFTTVMMKETPGYVFNSLSLYTAALTARSGIKVMARMFLLLITVMIVCAVAVIVLAIPDYRPEFLLPLLPHGWSPILHGTFIVAGFPFGEVFFFSMLLPFASARRKELGRKLLLGFAVSGTLLMLSTLSTLMAFGPVAGTMKYSLFRLAGEIEIAEIIQRIEAVIGIALILGSYMKASIFLFIFNRVLAEWLRLDDDRILIFPTGLVCLMLSITMFENPASFVDQVYGIWPFTVIAVGGSYVVLLTFVTLLRTMMRRPAKGGGARR
ncbi:GerAB/ArcD/ProY family transporter [Cohnella hongkongensis]|uniref:Endospore germination permease n=1 Tax=Cohnella hongkongensis TaxID=178337 RepID=A0ABV9FCA1_9BACL